MQIMASVTADNIEKNITHATPTNVVSTTIQTPCEQPQYKPMASIDVRAANSAAVGKPVIYEMVFKAAS